MWARPSLSLRPVGPHPPAPPVLPLARRVLGSASDGAPHLQGDTRSGDAGSVHEVVMHSTLAKIALTVAVIVGAVGFFFYSGSKHVGDYKMVDEVMVAPSQYQGKDMKVHGWVEPGSIQEDIVAQETVRTFVLEHNGQRIRVRNKGPKPDSFRDRSEVVAQGKIIDENGEPVMVATELMAKCPSKYEGAPKDKLFAQ